MTTTDKQFVIFSQSESEFSDWRSAGFWSNTEGWTTYDAATRFTELESVTLALPTTWHGDEEDAEWVSVSDVPSKFSNPSSSDEGEEASDASDGSLKVRLTLDVAYQLNGEEPNDMLNRLLELVQQAIGNGMLTGSTAAETEAYSVDAVVLPEPLAEEDIASYLSHQIEDGHVSLEGIPDRLARYGLMAPHVFVDEMRERMAGIVD